MRPLGVSRRIRREGTKTKVMEHTKGKRNKGPFPKSKNSRQWKKEGVRQRTTRNPRFEGHN